jgi:integrase
MNDVNVGYTFCSYFKDSMSDFINYKRSAGRKYKSEERLLKQFDSFIAKYPVSVNGLTKEIALAWIARKDGESSKTARGRFSVLRQFGIFLNNMGTVAYVPLYARKAKDTPFTPYIFSIEELERFFAACDSIDRHIISQMYTIFPVMMRLLYGCGLRVSEAIHLKNNDVDLNAGTIAILDSKFSKDRLIVMSDSLLEIMNTYFSNKVYSVDPTDYFFVNGIYGALKASTLYGRFRKVLWLAKISHGGRGKGPRLHDLRHNFAVYSLRNMVKEGMDIYVVLPILSTYLGHASIEATEKYLRLTPEVYQDLLNISGKVSSYVFPEVTL